MKLIESDRANLAKLGQRNPLEAGAPEMESAEWVARAAPGEPASRIARAAKRVIDVAIAVPIGLFLLPWLVVVIAAAIKCSSRGPILYGQVRLGQGGIPFRMWKFRTMVQDAERRLDEYFTDNPRILQEWNRGFQLKNDPRVIPRIGRLLRFSCLDELPQLWNVISGEMSLVGPRPLPAYHLDQFDEDFRMLRESMPPGITGQWQVCSRKDASPEMFRKWDTVYVRNWSLWMDLRILACTPWAVLFGTKVQDLPATEDTFSHR